jgi:hypothetical protein
MVVRADRNGKGVLMPNLRSTTPARRWHWRAIVCRAADEKTKFPAISRLDILRLVEYLGDRVPAPHSGRHPG